MVQATEWYDYLSDHTDVESVTRDCEAEDDTECPVYYYVHKRKDTPDTCGLVYYHGGYGVYGTALAESHIANKYAIQTGCTIFNVDYNLAPEHNFMN